MKRRYVIMPPKPDFNPYIHGTNSSVLALLPKTDFTFLSPIDMVELFNIAPIGGEITEGGLSTVMSKSAMAFGRLQSEGCNDYTLEKIIDNYAKAKLETQSTVELGETIKSQVQHGINISYSNINLLLIYIARAKQVGIPTSAFLSSEDIDELYKNIEGTIQFFYLVLLLGKKIGFNHDVLNAMCPESRDDTCDAICMHLSFKSILKKIIDSKIDLKAIYENPNPSDLDLKQVTNLLILPKESIVISGFGSDKQVTLPETDLFSTSFDLPDGDCPHNPNYFAYRMGQNLSGWSLNDLLLDFARSMLTNEFFLQFHVNFSKHIDALQHRLQVLKGIIEVKPSNIIDTESKSFVSYPFPIVFVSEQHEKMKLESEHSAEYRAQAPLKLGADIKMIATDSLMHKKELKNYLQKHSLDGVSVVTFEQLKQSKITGIRPGIPGVLLKYIARIERYRLKNGGEKIDFSHGFWVCKKSRAINREANYLLAKKLLEDITVNVDKKLNNINGQRDEIIQQQAFFNRPGYVKRKINSSELNGVIKEAVSLNL